MAAPIYTTASGQLFHAGQILIATVGLPARGKTHLAHALERYLLWLGVKARVFSLGDYRRQRLGRPHDLPPDYFAASGKTPATQRLRAQVLDEFDAQVLQYFRAGNQVAIYDANNGKAARRAALAAKFAPLHVSVMFLETICDDPRVIEHNVRAVKLRSPDYQGWKKDEAVRDFYHRIETRQAEYESISSASTGPDLAHSWIKIINAGERVIVNNIRGYLQSRICFFLMNVHNRDRSIYLARAGEALIEHLYKADADLSSLGWQYAEELTDYMDKLRRERERERPDRSAASSPTALSPRLAAVGRGFTGLQDEHPGQPGKPKPLASSPLGASPPPADHPDTKADKADKADKVGPEGHLKARALLHSHGAVQPQGQSQPTRPTLPSRAGSSTYSETSSGPGRRLEVWTSNRRRAAHTCSFFPQQGDKVVEKSQLCELNPGMVDGMTEAEIKDLYPVEHARLQKEPYGGRYPRAESYHDLCVRIEPVIMELERASSDILIVAQSSVLRVLLGYLQGRSPQEIPRIDVPEGDVLEVTPQAYGMQTRAHHFWDPVVRRRQRDQAWVREQRAASASRAHSRAPSRARSAAGSPQMGPRSARSSHGTLPSPHMGGVLSALTPAHGSGLAQAHQHHARAGSGSVSNRSHAHVPGHAIPPLDLAQPRGQSGDHDEAVDTSEEEEAEIRRARRETERIAALDQLADELGDTGLVDDTPSVTQL